MSTLARHLLLADRAQSILSALDLPAAGAPGFMPFGYRAPGRSRMAWNGQIAETSANCYLLGNGHRAYYPVLGRFSRPDAWSPFGKGGLNAYVYCQGDPLNARDPSGRISVGFMLHGAFIAGGFATLGVGIWLVTKGEKVVGISIAAGAAFVLTPALMGMGFRLVAKRTLSGPARRNLQGRPPQPPRPTSPTTVQMGRRPSRFRNPLANPSIGPDLNRGGPPVPLGLLRRRAAAPPTYNEVFELGDPPPAYSAQIMGKSGVQPSLAASSPQRSDLRSRAEQIRRGGGRGVTSSL
jgi:RHS repeat-associated protein